MFNKKWMSIELASLITLAGVSALMTTVSLLPAPPAQSQSVLHVNPNIKLHVDPNIKVWGKTIQNLPTTLEYLKDGLSATSLPSIAELGINLSGAYYQASGNQTIASNDKYRGLHPFECVEFAYGRSIERGLFQNNQGIGAVLMGDAHTWDDRVLNSPYRGQFHSQVRANSIVVWEANQKFTWKEGNNTSGYNTDPVAGHVAFVEKVNPDGSFIISEGNHQAQPVIKRIISGTSMATAAKFIYL